MLFRKRHKRLARNPEGVGSGVATGYEAIYSLEDICDATLSQTRSLASDTTVSMFGEATSVRTLPTASSMGGFLVGAAAAGARVSGLTRDDDLVSLIAALSDASAKGVPFVLHHTCYDGTRKSEVPGHESIRSVLDTGAVVLFASGMQQAHDLALVGRRIAEEALLPVIVVQDAFDPIRTLETLHLADAPLVNSYLGRADDRVSSPTPSQDILYGPQRRRVPMLFDVERPVAIGAPLGSSARRRSAIGQSVFVFAHVAAISDGAMVDFVAATGRTCGALEPYRVDDADFVIVAQGLNARRLHAVADHFRTRRKKRVGVVQIVRVRPFPTAPLSHLLKGKKAVTVLDSIPQTYEEMGPLGSDVRQVIERSREKGRPPKSPASPDCAVFRDGDAPVLYCATADAVPADADLIALVDNMVGSGKTSVRLGKSFATTGVRLPLLERLVQRINASYPDADANLLPPTEDSALAETESVTIEISGSAEEAGEAGRMIAEGLFLSFGWPVRSGLVAAEGFATALCATSYRAGAAPLGQPGPADILALTEDRLFRHPDLIRRLRAGGALIVATDRDVDAFWYSLSRRVRENIRTSDPRLFVVSGRTSESAVENGEYDRLAETMMLAGAAMAVQFERAADRQVLLDGCAASLNRRRSRWTREACVDATLHGADGVVHVDWRRFAPTRSVHEKERTAPWTARESSVTDESVFDAGRFWQSVGYLYETGREDATPIDPFVASGVVPARTSAFRSWSETVPTIASLIPENCTGCGACWSICPDAALPAMIQDVGSLVERCFADCASRNVPLTQLDRIKPHLVKQAYRLVASDERHVYRSLDSLLGDAFKSILERLNVDEAQEERLRSDFGALREATRALPFARTEVFFTTRSKDEKGSGLLLTIAVNPDACKACGLCVEVCPENAMEMVDRSPDLVDLLRHQWSFARAMPVVPHDRIEACVSNDHPDTLAYRLLDWRSYHTTVGGDSGAPGDGIRATVHLVTSFIDAVIRPRLDAFARRIEEMIRRLEERIGETIHQSLEISDFEQFRKRLDDIGDQPLDAARLAEIVAAKEAEIDTKHLKVLTDTLHDLRRVHERYESKRMSGATLAATLASSSTTAGAHYPYNPFAFPWVRAASTDATAIAEGTFAGIVDQAVRDFRCVRKATLVIENLYDPAERDVRLDELDWQNLTDDEWALCPPVCVLAEHASDVLPEILTTSLPLKVFILERDVDAIHGASPGLWPLARPDFFVYHGTAGYPGPLLHGIIEGLAWRGPAVYRLYVCDPERDGAASDRAAERMRLAVDSRAFPLLQYNPGVPGEWIDRWTLDGNPDPDSGWVTRRDADDAPGAEGSVFTLADWAAGDVRFRDFFEPVPHNRWTPHMIPLAQYLDLKEEERVVHEPFVTVHTRSGQQARVRVHPPMVAASLSALARWRMIQELAGVSSSTVDAVRRSVRHESDEVVEKMRETITADLQAEYKRRHELTTADYHARLTDKLLVLSGYAPGDTRSEEKLREVLSKAAEYIPSAQEDEPSAGANGTRNSKEL